MNFITRRATPAHGRLAACALALLALAACNKTPPEPTSGPPATATAPVVGPFPGVGSAPSSVASAASTSVPSAASVLSPANEAKPDPTAGRSNKSMSRAEESTAMPLPGQNNDHSAPLPPAKPASR